MTFHCGDIKRHVVAPHPRQELIENEAISAIFRRLIRFRAKRGNPDSGGSLEDAKALVPEVPSVTEDYGVRDCSPCQCQGYRR